MTTKYYYRLDKCTARQLGTIKLFARGQETLYRHLKEMVFYMRFWRQLSGGICEEEFSEVYDLLLLLQIAIGKGIQMESMILI